MRRHATTFNLTDRDLHAPFEKRFSNARFTLFDTGLGACGKTNSPSDFVRLSFFLLCTVLLVNNLILKPISFDRWWP